MVFNEMTLLRRRRVVLAALGAGVTALQSNALGQSAVQRAPVITPAPSAPEGDWRTREAVEAERKRLEKIRIEDERLAKLPKDQRVLRPKSVEINGKKYVELDMYGTRFRIPPEYVGQLPPHGGFVDGYFWWPQKIAVGDRAAEKYYPRLPPYNKSMPPEFGREISRRNSQIVQYRISASSYGRQGVKLIDSTRYEKMATDNEQLQFLQVVRNGVPYWGANVPDKIVRVADDIRRGDGSRIELILRTSPYPGNTDPLNATYKAHMEFRGLGVDYIFSRRLAPEWKEIHTEVLHLLDQWTKE